MDFAESIGGDGDVVNGSGGNGRGVKGGVTGCAVVVVYFRPDWFQQRRAEKTEGLVTGGRQGQQQQLVRQKVLAPQCWLPPFPSFFSVAVAEQDGDDEGQSHKNTPVSRPIVGRRLLGQNAPASQIHVLCPSCPAAYAFIPLPPMGLGDMYYAPYIF